MAKVILEFELDEGSEESPNQDQLAAIAAIKAPQLVKVIYDLDTFIRNMLKYQTLSDETVEKVESIRKELHELVDFTGVIEVVFSK